MLSIPPRLINNIVGLRPCSACKEGKRFPLKQCPVYKSTQLWNGKQRHTNPFSCNILVVQNKNTKSHVTIDFLAEIAWKYTKSSEIIIFDYIVI